MQATTLQMKPVPVNGCTDAIAAMLVGWREARFGRKNKNEAIQNRTVSF